MEFSTETVIATRNLLVKEIKRHLKGRVAIDAREMEQSLREVLQEIGRETLGEIWEMQDEIIHKEGVSCHQHEEKRGKRHKVRRISRREAQVNSVFGEVR